MLLAHHQSRAESRERWTRQWVAIWRLFQRTLTMQACNFDSICVQMTWASIGVQCLSLNFKLFVSSGVWRIWSGCIHSILAAFWFLCRCRNTAERQTGENLARSFSRFDHRPGLYWATVAILPEMPPDSSISVDTAHKHTHAHMYIEMRWDLLCHVLPFTAPTHCSRRWVDSAQTVSEAFIRVGKSQWARWWWWKPVPFCARAPNTGVDSNWPWHCWRHRSLKMRTKFNQNILIFNHFHTYSWRWSFIDQWCLV